MVKLNTGKADSWAHSQVQILHTAVHQLCGIKKDNPKQTKANLVDFPALGPWMYGSVSQVRAAIPVDAATDSGLDSFLALHMPRFLFCGAETQLSLGWGEVLVALLLL